MQRRGFLGIVAGVIGTGPKALAKAAAPAGMEALKLTGVMQSIDNFDGEIPASDQGPDGQKARAKKWLKRLMGVNVKEEELKRRTQWIDGLDPDTATLRSMSIGAKIRRTRRLQYDQQKHERKLRYQGILDGWFNDD